MHEIQKRSNGIGFVGGSLPLKPPSLPTESTSKPLEEDNRIISQAEVGNNQESSKMESGKNSNNKNKNENDTAIVLVLNRSQFLSQKCGLQMVIKIINFKTLPYSSTLHSHLQNLTLTQAQISSCWFNTAVLGPGLRTL